MPSQATLDRQNLSHEVDSNGIEMAPCTGCQNTKRKPGDPPIRCLVGPRSGKCSNCIRKGYKCDVAMSRPQWEKLRDTRDKLRHEIEKIEEEEVELMHKLAARRSKKIRLRKQLRLSERRTDDAVAQELEELEAAEDAENELLGLDLGPLVEVPELPFSFHGILEMSPQGWGSLEGIPLSAWADDDRLFSESSGQATAVPVTGPEASAL